MIYDQFDHSRALDSCEVVIVEKRGEVETTFPVSATILSSVSQYFDQSFHEASFREAQQKRIVIESTADMRISASDFLAFVRHAYDAREKINGSTFLGLLKCGDYFSSKQILADVEQFIIENCCPSKWRANKKNETHPFAIELISGIELAFAYQLQGAKEQMKRNLLKMRFHTFLRTYPEVMLLPDDIRLWIFDTYAHAIIASQKA